MATNQTHHDLRHALTTTINAILVERESIAADAARYTAIGVPSVGDGGVAATGQLADAVEVLTEALDPASGDVDMDGLTPVFAAITQANTAAAPIDIGTSGTGKDLIVRVAHVLPFFLLEAVTEPGGVATNITAFATVTYAKTTFTGLTGLVSVATITIRDVSATLASGLYKLRLTNPLDAAAAAGLSGNVYLVAP